MVWKQPYLLLIIRVKHHSQVSNSIFWLLISWHTHFWSNQMVAIAESWIWLCLCPLANDPNSQTSRVRRCSTGSTNPPVDHRERQVWPLLLSTHITQAHIFWLSGTLENTMVIDLGCLLCPDQCCPIYSGIISKLYFSNCSHWSNSLTVCVVHMEQDQWILRYLPTAITFALKWALWLDAMLCKFHADGSNPL